MVLKMVTNKVVVDLNVFNAFVKNIVVSNMDSTLIVTVDRGCRCQKFCNDRTRPPLGCGSCKHATTTLMCVCERRRIHEIRSYHQSSGNLKCY